MLSRAAISCSAEFDRLGGRVAGDAQSPGPADPLDLYDENENGVIDGDEALRAAEDHFAGRIDRALASRVLELYFDVAAPVRGQSWPSLCDRYDGNNDDMINKAEYLAALDDYFAGIITKHEFLTVAECYLRAPTAPTDLTARVYSDGSNGIVLSWTAPPGVVTGYEVQRHMGAEGLSYSTIATFTNVAVWVYVDTDLIEGTTYQYRVRARNGEITGTWATSPSITFNLISGPWSVLGYKRIPIDWIVPLAERSATDEYKLVVPADTGLQINRITAQNSKRCNWQSPPSTETSWVDLGTSFYLVRCKLGTGTTNIVVKKRPRSDPNSAGSPVRTLGPILQSWHRADHQVAYKITSPLLGDKPPGAYPNYTQPSQRDSETAINNAAVIWNGIDPNHPLRPGQTVPLTFDLVSASPDVTIRGYWNPVGAQLPGKCGTIACTYAGGTYPELGHQELWIEYPPQFASDSNYMQWTNDPDIANAPMTNYYYLPRTMMHEFGHTAGLGHAADRSYSIMGSYKVWEAPQPYDLNGMKGFVA